MAPAVLITSAVRARLAELAGCLWDRRLERGVVLVGRQKGDRIIVRDFWPVENVHPQPRLYFFMGKNQWRRIRNRAARLGYLPVAVIHSHPDTGDGAPAGPSDDDLSNARQYSRMVPIWGVYHSPSSELAFYTGHDGVTERKTLPLPELPARGRPSLRQWITDALS
jgi:proteasome lid subunit RPN8/RPN11